MSKPLRSQPTRDRILEAARTIFGEEGYDRTTIRAVAQAAGIHPSMVMRYYGTKEGLFAAAAQFDLQLPDLSSIPRGELGRAIVRHSLRRWDSETGDLPALLRMSVTHEEARQRLRDIFHSQVMPAIAKLAPPRRAAKSAALVTTQLLGLALTRYILRLPAVVDLSERVLVDEIGPKIQGYIDGTEAS